MTDEAIASALDISVGTVRGYWLRIRTKLGGSGRAELVAQWMQLNSAEDGERLARDYNDRTQSNHEAFETVLAKERASMDELFKHMNAEQRATMERIRGRSDAALSHVRDECAEEQDETE